MNDIVPRRAVERCERLAKLGPPPAWWRVFALRRWLRAYRAIMALDISAAAEMLRGMYPAERVEEMARERPWVQSAFDRLAAGKGEPIAYDRWIDPVERRGEK